MAANFLYGDDEFDIENKDPYKVEEERAAQRARPAAPAVDSMKLLEERKRMARLKTTEVAVPSSAPLGTKPASPKPLPTTSIFAAAESYQKSEPQPRPEPAKVVTEELVIVRPRGMSVSSSSDEETPTAAGPAAGLQPGEFDVSEDEEDSRTPPAVPVPPEVGEEARAFAARAAPISPAHAHPLPPLPPGAAPAEATAAPTAAAPPTEEEAPAPAPVDILPSGALYFALRPAPPGHTYRCTVKRDRSGVNRLHPKFSLFLEPGGDRAPLFLMASRKRKKSASANYVISSSRNNLENHGCNYLGAVKGNFLGTEFTLFDEGNSADEKAPRRELLAVVYSKNILGRKGPRELQAVIPRVVDGESVPFSAIGPNDCLLERVKYSSCDGLLSLKTKAPVYNAELNAYTLNFSKRVKRASVKNFQLVSSTDPNSVLLQFGREDDDTFILDFQHPLSAFQAFAVALSSCERKFGTE